MTIDEKTTLAIAWWGECIALAIDDDPESRAQLAEATGDPDAWRAFAVIDPEDDHDAAEAFAEFLLAVAQDPDHVDAYRPVLGTPGYDAVFGKVAEASSRLVRGLLAGNPACLPR